MTEEEQRAADYRAQCVARRVFLKARSDALAAPPGSAQAVKDAWAPLLDLASQATVCDDPIPESKLLGQLTSGGQDPKRSPAVKRLRAAVGEYTPSAPGTGSQSRPGADTR